MYFVIKITVIGMWGFQNDSWALRQCYALICKGFPPTFFVFKPRQFYAIPQGGRQADKQDSSIRGYSYLYQDITFLHELIFTIRQKTLIFAQGFTIFLSVVAQKLEAAPEAVTGTQQTACLFGMACMPYFGNFWFRIQTFKGFPPILLRDYV